MKYQIKFNPKSFQLTIYNLILNILLYFQIYHHSSTIPSLKSHLLNIILPRFYLYLLLVIPHHIFRYSLFYFLGISSVLSFIIFSVIYFIIFPALSFMISFALSLGRISIFIDTCSCECPIFSLSLYTSDNIILFLNWRVLPNYDILGGLLFIFAERKNFMFTPVLIFWVLIKLLIFEFTPIPRQNLF